MLLEGGTDVPSVGIEDNEGKKERREDVKEGGSSPPANQQIMSIARYSSPVATWQFCLANSLFLFFIFFAVPSAVELNWGLYPGTWPWC